jgi:hypothetical protein
VATVLSAHFIRGHDTIHDEADAMSEARQWTYHFEAEWWDMQTIEAALSYYQALSGQERAVALRDACPPPNTTSLPGDEQIEMVRQTLRKTPIPSREPEPPLPPGRYPIKVELPEDEAMALDSVLSVYSAYCWMENIRHWNTRYHAHQLNIIWLRRRRWAEPPKDA